MNKTVKIVMALIGVMIILGAFMLPAFADDDGRSLIAPVSESGEKLIAAPESEIAEEEETEEADAGTNVKSAKAIAAAIVLAFASAAGAIAMAIAIKSASDGTARQPEAAGSIRSGMMLGLVFIETVVIYALIVAIMIIFVL